MHTSRFGLQGWNEGKFLIFILSPGFLGHNLLSLQRDLQDHVISFYGYSLGPRNGDEKVVDLTFLKIGIQYRLACADQGDQIQGEVLQQDA